MDSPSAESRGHKVTVFQLRDMKIHPCLGCLHGGQDTLRPCTQSDDMDLIYHTYRKSQVIVFATPLFFWSYSGLLKIAMDRLWALAEGEKDELHGNQKTGVLLMAAGGAHPEPLLTHFGYLMKRMEWTNAGNVVLKHTDDLDMDHISLNPDAFQLGASL